MVRCNMLKNCPVSAPNITVAKRVYGPNIAGVQGKGVRRSLRPTVGDYIDFSPQIRDLNNVLDISAIIVLINGLAFFITSSHNVGFLTGESTEPIRKT